MLPCAHTCPARAHATPRFAIQLDKHRPLSFISIADDGDEQHWSPAEHADRIGGMAARLVSVAGPGAAVGLLFRSGVDLVETWLACLKGGLRPLVMQYPTRKQSRAYWFDSVTNTIDSARLDLIVADAYCAGLGLPHSTKLIGWSELVATAAGETAVGETGAGPQSSVIPDQFTILQLSSGTTGYRKAMEFTSADLRRHTLDFNMALDLRPERDRMVSWLPLYHDMGFVACFVMPLLLDIDVVMMDPVSWVQRPGMLFEAIDRHQGTIAYMPNFGFELMSRTPCPEGIRALPSMRQWVCAGEQVSAATAGRFCTHIGADPASFRPLFGMAENMFAITIGRGFETRLVEGAEVVSCGPPIPGVELKTVDGEIFVRSSTAIAGYLGGQELARDDGYYASGDLGRILNGELYVSGRRQDLLIQAGRKFMLSDLDLTLNETFPEVRGRAASLAVRDERLGTETPLILIEAVDFFELTDTGAIAGRMMDLLGLDQLEVAYVPPRFITKTSSGKVNRRKTLCDWIAAREAKRRAAPQRDLVQQLHDIFSHVDWSRPVSDVLDSLSTTVVKIILETTDVAFDADRSLDTLAEMLKISRVAAPAAERLGIRIVSLADRNVLSRVNEAKLSRLGERLGCPVTLEHICLPPSPVLLSDLIFHDWVQPRLEQDVFSDVDQALMRLAQASVILVDNLAELKFLYKSTYPVLSHALERDPGADLICMRWPSYTRQHHKLPLSYVTGNDIPLDTCNITLAQLSRYLRVPIFRIASIPGFEAQCAAWEFTWDAEARPPAAEAQRLVRTLGDWIEQRGDIRRVALRPGPALLMSDLSHFCAISTRQAVIDRVLDRYDSFYVAGQAASLPYLRHQLDRLGKPYVLVPSYAQDVIDAIPERYECVVSCGSFGERPGSLPFISFQHVGDTQRLHNLGAFEAELAEMGAINDVPPSKTDWYHSFPLVRSEVEWRAWRRARKVAREAKNAHLARAERRYQTADGKSERASDDGAAAASHGHQDSVSLTLARNDVP